MSDEDSFTLTKTNHIKKRNMIMQVVLMLITPGIYAIYRFYSTLRELHIANGKDDGELPWAVLALIPLLDLLAYWHYSSEFATFNDANTLP